jgi:TusA-related sulfurtransferase
MRIDVRNMEPPQPMIRVVQVLEKLQEGDVLEVLGSRPFTYLLPKLSEMGYEYELRETEEGFLLRVWRSGPTKPISEEEPTCARELDFEINEDTNVGELLKRVPEALNVLIKYGFTPLKNPILRRILPHTVTLGHAKKIRRLSDEKFAEMLRELRSLIGK